MANFGQEYAWALTHGVALASLNNVANEIGARNRRAVGDKLHPVGIASQMVDEFPVREIALSGKERGDGTVFHQWQLTLATYGVKYILDTYLSSAATVSKAVTIYTRVHWLATYKRYNAWLVLPKPGDSGDIQYIRQGVYRVTLRFNDLVAL